MRQALTYASRGYGKTYPNPAVGCVIVQNLKQANKKNDSSSCVIGKGFHPRAGMPHAEIFALLEAAGYLSDGVSAAMECINSKNNSKVESLLEFYCEENGAYKLFHQRFSEIHTTTAYVTLEPCCHYGKTPPCALSLVYAGINRVVIGYPDPNPKVNGGGVKILQDSGVKVDFIKNKLLKEDCSHLIQYFLKRITYPKINRTDTINGKKKRLLRSIASTKKRSNTINTMIVGNTTSPSWFEAADEKLWQNELLLLRMRKICSTKKDAKGLGEMIAEELNAYIVQVLGHTVLLYRPVCIS